MRTRTLAAASAAALAVTVSAGAGPPSAAAPVPYDPVTIELDRPRRLFLSWRAMRRIRELTGFDFREPSVGEPWDTEMVPTVLCEMLRHEDPEITIDQVEDELIHIGNLAYVLDRIFACMGVDTAAVAQAMEETAGEEGADGEPPLEPAAEA